MIRPSDPNGSRAKILVIRGGAIGDFILTLPVLAALREQFPKARLELLGYARTAELARAGGLVEEVRSIDARPLAGFFARQGSLADELQEYFAGFAIIISYLYDPDTVFQTNVARCSKAQFITGPHRPDERGKIHATEVFLKPLERLAIFDADPVPRLAFESRRAAFDRFVVLHPGSGSETKNWPETNWAELIGDLLRNTDWNLLLVGGEAEGEKLDRLASGLPASRVQLARNLPLLELAARMAGTQAFVGHDSGITHLAAALGLPGVVLWGPAPEAVWRPRSERMKVLREPAGLARLSVEKVAGEVKFSLMGALTNPGGG
jgi:heptosyltransferase-2